MADNVIWGTDFKAHSDKRVMSDISSEELGADFASVFHADHWDICLTVKPLYTHPAPDDDCA